MIEIIKKVRNREIDEFNEKVVDIPEGWNKIDKKVEEVKRK